jgi:FAD/FMN-containing dehydrogenase
MSLEGELRSIVGAAHVLTDPSVRAGYETDWTGAYQGRAVAVTRPATTAEVAEVVLACARAGAAVVPQGRNTGLVGGSIPGEGGDAVILSTRRLDAAGTVDRAAGQVTVGAGTTLTAAQQIARDSGHDVPVDLAARESATIGGMAATNAGGVHVLRHGTMRRQVMGVEAVLAGGAVLSHLAGLEKDNTGYDLAGLLCGSEGTLGVLTTIRLRLVPRPAHRVTALLAWPDLATMVAGVARLRAELPGLEAAEYVVRAGVELVQAVFGVAEPFDHAYPAYVVIEAAGPTDPTSDVADAVGRLEEVLDAAVADTPRRREELWRLRELHTEALAAIGPPRKYDVTLPLDNLATSVAGVVTMVEDHPGLSCHHFGHLGDGNVHLNVVGPASPELDGEVLELVAAAGGSISAEHGIGRLKRPWLHLSRSPDEIAAMRAVKAALDPDGVLNPGVLLPD